MKTVYLGLGSNVGDRRAQLQNALKALNSGDVEVTGVSPVYETEPQGLREQPWFLNMVVEAHTSLFPLQLLTRIEEIEKQFGRRRMIPNGPRTLDIDILLYGRAVIRSERLVVPHPRYTERRFVLAPLHDLAPDLRDPVNGKSIREMLLAVANQPIRRLAKSLQT